MAQLLQPFNARNVDPTQGMGGLPIGKHPVIAVKSEVKPTKDNDSGFLQFDLQIIDGPNKGTTGAYRLNLYHSSQQTVEIAHRQLSALCHVTGVFDVQDSSQLHNIPFIVEVALQKEPNPNKYTEVKRVFDINGNEPGHQGQNNGQNAAQGQPQNNGGAWGNNGGQNNQQPQNNQPQNNGGNGGGWGNQPQNNVASNVPMPGNDQNQGQQPQNNGQQGGGWNQGGQNNGGQQNGGGAPAWGQNNGGAGNAPAWGQPK